MLCRAPLQSVVLLLQQTLLSRESLGVLSSHNQCLRISYTVNLASQGSLSLSTSQSPSRPNQGVR